MTTNPAPTRAVAPDDPTAALAATWRMVAMWADVAARAARRIPDQKDPDQARKDITELAALLSVAHRTVQAMAGAAPDPEPRQVLAAFREAMVEDRDATRKIHRESADGMRHALGHMADLMDALHKRINGGQDEKKKAP